MEASVCVHAANCIVIIIIIIITITIIIIIIISEHYNSVTN
jgi:hypothetical protein